MRTGTLHSERGFTLLESVVVLAVLLIIGYVVLRFGMAASQASTQDNLTLQAQRQARLGIDLMSEELRLADANTLNPTGLSVGLGMPLGYINQPFIQFQTVTWDPVTNDRVNSTWIEYILGPDPVAPANANRRVVLRRQYAETLLPPATVTSVRTVARDVYTEDTDGDGVSDGDANGDGIFQQGLWFEVGQEDVNDDDLLTPLEDLNGNGEPDAVVRILLDTQVLGMANTWERGNATVETIVEVRN